MKVSESLFNHSNNFPGPEHTPEYIKYLFADRSEFLNYSLNHSS